MNGRQLVTIRHEKTIHNGKNIEKTIGGRTRSRGKGAEEKLCRNGCAHKTRTTIEPAARDKAGGSRAARWLRGTRGKNLG